MSGTFTGNVQKNFVSSTKGSEVPVNCVQNLSPQTFTSTVNPEEIRLQSPRSSGRRSCGSTYLLVFVPGCFRFLAFFVRATN